MSIFQTCSWHNDYVAELPCSLVDCGSSPRPNGLNSRQVRECAQDRSLTWPSPPWGGVISCFLSLCLSLSGECTCPIAKTSPKKKKKVYYFLISSNRYLCASHCVGHSWEQKRHTWSLHFIGSQSNITERQP